MKDGTVKPQEYEAQKTPDDVPSGTPTPEQGAASVTEQAADIAEGTPEEKAASAPEQETETTAEQADAAPIAEQADAPDAEEQGAAPEEAAPAEEQETAGVSQQEAVDASAPLRHVPVEKQYEKLEAAIRDYNPQADFDLIRGAYEFAKAKHNGQLRKSGEPYIIHPIAVARIIAELKLDSESIAAALLHDVIEDTPATHEDVERLFGKTVADLVEGVSKLTRIQYDTVEDEQMENFRKMLMAMNQDIRVILIKICDRLHNMRTMDFQPPAKQRQKSLETMEIYVPIAYRLGIRRVKS